MNEFKKWYICIDRKVDSSYNDQETAHDIYYWMLTEEGLLECQITEADKHRISIHGGHMTIRELEKQLAGQKAWTEMLESGLAE